MTATPEINLATGRLRVGDVQRLHQLIGGDPMTEEMILRFIGDRWQAPNLLYLPAKVAGEILRRPAAFLRAAKQHCEPAVPF